MAEYSTPEQRTEMPTDRRMGQLRREGALFHSQELEHTISLATGFLIVSYMVPVLFRHAQYVFRKAFELIANREPLDVHSLYEGFIGILTLMGPDILIIVLAVAVASTLAVMLQTKWNVKEKKLHLRFTMLNPINGIRRIFSIAGTINILKSIVKLIIILPMAYFSLRGFAPRMVQLMHMQIDQTFIFTGDAMRQIFWKIFYILMALSIFDYTYGKFRWLRTNKMTKDEVKDERKSIEGDEETKKTIQRKGWQRIIQRIRDTVPTADVVVTNPTHYAIALKYDRASMAAPVVVAKGRNFLALRIREIAREHGIPVLERKPLARALYSGVEIGSTIPRDMFKAVAEVLAYVYRLKGIRPKPSTKKQIKK